MTTLEILIAGAVTFVVGCARLVASKVCADLCQTKVHAEEKARKKLEEDKQIHEKFRSAIQKKESTEELQYMLEDNFFENSLERLRRVQSDRIRKIRGLDTDRGGCCPCFLKQPTKPHLEIPLKEAKESWAEDWARSSSREEIGAKSLDIDRHTILRLLYQVCNCCFGKDGKIKSEAEAEFLKAHRETIHAIMTSCIVMDRANALYCMEDTTTGERGLHWYSKLQEREMKRRDMKFVNKYGGTMNKRFLWLKGFFEKDELFCNDEMLQAWLEPTPKPSEQAGYGTMS